MDLTLKYKLAGWGDASPRVRSKSFFRDVRKWNQRAVNGVCAVCGRPAPIIDRPCECGVAGMIDRPRIFMSLCDPWDKMANIKDLADMLETVRVCKNLDFLMLTKRIELWRERIEAAGDYDSDHGNRILCGWVQDWWKHGIAPPNIWMGVTCGTQATADERIPILLSIPAKVRWLSVEPILEPVDIAKYIGYKKPLGISFVVVGGESGAKRREATCEGGSVWAVCNVAEQCDAAGVACWVKQDCARLPGQQGRIPTDYWNRKELPW